MKSADRKMEVKSMRNAKLTAGGEEENRKRISLRELTLS
jgi:hypothetical protein